MWQTLLPPIQQFLPRPDGELLWYGWALIESGEALDTRAYGSLEAYLAGVLVLSGDLPRAKRVGEANDKVWMLAGLPPEALDWQTGQVTSDSYPLRPEVIESTWYLWRATRWPSLTWTVTRWRGSNARRSAAG